MVNHRFSYREIENQKEEREERFSYEYSYLLMILRLQLQVLRRGPALAPFEDTRRVRSVHIVIPLRDIRGLLGRVVEGVPPHA